jgi:hypothetical protein
LDTKKIIQNEFEKRIGIKLPKSLIDIVTYFSLKFGGFDKGLDKFLSYINSSYLVSVKEGRSYENTPIEFSPFIATGSNGDHYGYLELAPELKQDDFPIICYSPGTGSIDFFGNTTIEGLENLLNYSNSHNNFSEIDIPFLNSIKIYPDKTSTNKDFFSINYDPDELITLPIIIPTNYSYLTTHDGVGVLALSTLFNSNKKEFTNNYNAKEFINEAKINITNGFLASALFCLKEAFWHNPYGQNFDIMEEIINLMILVYAKLGRDEYSKRLIQEYDWILKP